MDKVMAVRNEYREQQWALVIKECADSGLTNKEYCRQHGISEKSFYYWLRKLRKQVCEQAAPQIVAIDPIPKTDELLRIEYKGAELKLPANVDMNAVAAVLLSLQAPMIDLGKVRNYYIACGYTDLRCGIDGLAAIVTQQYGKDFDEESLFLFCGRRTDRIKALYWSGDGYILLYKRLSNGRFQWPRSEAELRLINPQSFRWLMEGLRIEEPKAIRKSTQKDMF